MRKTERGATWPGSSRPTRRSIGSPDPEDVPSTADQKIGLVKAGRLNSCTPVRWRALEGRWRLHVASYVGPDREAV